MSDDAAGRPLEDFDDQSALFKRIHRYATHEVAAACGWLEAFEPTEDLAQSVSREILRIRAKSVFRTEQELRALVRTVAERKCRQKELSLIHI